jgi:glycosyltransferase involved in cell wall biosynthesis
LGYRCPETLEESVPSVNVLDRSKFPGKLGLQQRVLPVYRSQFLYNLASVCQAGLSIFAGQAQQGEAINSVRHLEGVEIVQTRNWHLGKVHSSYYMCWQSGILRWLRAWQPDALVVEANPRYISNRLAIRWMHSRGHPVIGWGLGAPPLTGISGILRRYERWSFLSQLDAIIAYSQRGAQQYRQLGFAEDKVWVATNAVAPRPISPPPERSPDFTGCPVVLFVGRLQKRKRIDLLMRACSNLSEGLQPKLVVVGDGPARAELEKLAGSTYPRAEFVGARQGAELYPYFQHADLFVLPGTGGLAVQEAMGFGLPVIVAEGDGTQDDLVRAENGWLISSDSLPDLTTALSDALSDASRLRRMGAASYEIAAKEINVEAMVEVFLTALEYVNRFEN